MAFKRGEKGSYQAIYERHSARVHGVCRRMLLSREDAAEASQETFLKVYQALDRFNGRYQLGAWITRIATNVCLDHLRASARRPTAWAPLEELDEKDLPRQIRLEEEPESFIIKKTEGSRVFKVLRSLPPLHRAAIVLRDFEGLSYCEIAAALGMSESQVKALLHRARKGFKRSWSTGGLAAVLPWNLVARLRRGDVGLSEHVNTAATSAGPMANVAGSAANVAANCSIALQQCGQAIGERFATAMTALVVGTAAISTGVATSSPAAPVDAGLKASAQDSPSEMKASVLGKKTRLKRGQEPAPHRGAAQEPVAEPRASSAPVPKPTTSPTTAPAPAPTGGAGAGPKPTPSSEPTYAPVAPAIGWERGGVIPATVPTSNVMALDCAAKTFTQRLETTVHDGDASYPGLVDVALSGSMRLDLTVWKYDQEIVYNGGSPRVVVSGSGRDTVWTMSGSYAANGAHDPRQVHLPLYGRFNLRLGLDCLASVIKSELLTLSAD